MNNFGRVDVVDAHFGRHDDDVVAGHVEARRPQSVSSVQKGSKLINFLPFNWIKVKSHVPFNWFFRILWDFFWHFSGILKILKIWKDFWNILWIFQDSWWFFKIFKIDWFNIWRDFSGLNACDIFISILSDPTIQSTWTEQELNWFQVN